MCKNHTSVFHSSTESEIISLDAGLRMDVLLSLNLWDVIIEAVRSSNSAKAPIEPASGNRLETGDWSRIPSKTKPKEDTDVELFVTLEYVPSNAHSCQGESQLYIFEHSEAVKNENQGKNPAVRHVSRRHRVSFDWLFDRINFDSKIQIRYASHFFSVAQLITRTCVAQVVSLACAHHICVHVVCLILFDYSIFLSLLSIFSLIILSFLLAINFFFHDVVDKFPVHFSANEDLGNLAEYDPLTGYEPNDYHISETTESYIQESSSENVSLNSHDLEYDDVTIGIGGLFTTVHQGARR